MGDILPDAALGDTGRDLDGLRLADFFAVGSGFAILSRSSFMGGRKQPPLLYFSVSYHIFAPYAIRCAGHGVNFL